jgi:hypothetical protein
MTRAADVSTQAVSAGFITVASAAKAGRVHTHSDKNVAAIIHVSKHAVFRNLRAIAHMPFLVE